MCRRRLQRCTFHVLLAKSSWSRQNYYYYIRLTVFFQDTWVSRHQKDKPFWILLEQEMMGGSDISWTICKSFAPYSRLITMPVPHHSSRSRQKWARKFAVSCSWTVSTLTLLVGRHEDHLACVWSKVQMIWMWSSWYHCNPIISCVIKIQIGVTLLVLAYPGCPGKESVKLVSVSVLYCSWT